jgi:hypothetical protein
MTLNHFVARGAQQPARPLSKRRLLILVSVLLAIFLATRLPLLLRLPPFIDEGLHSYYVRAMEDGIISAGAGDGKWLSILIFYGLTRLPLSTLLVIRLASVVAGALTLVAIFLTGRTLSGARAGLLSALFYVFLPYAWFYNRLGLTDGVAVALGAWTLLVSILVLRSDKGPYSVILTALLLASLLAKATSMLFILFPLLALLILTPRAQWRSAVRKILPAILGATLIAVVMLSQDMGTAEILHKTVQTRSTGFFEQAAANAGTAAGWFWTLLSPPLAFLGVAAILSLLIWRRDRGLFYLLAVLAAVLAPYVLTAATWYPRYLLFALVPLALVLGLFWHRLTGLIERMTTPRRGTILAAAPLTLLLIWPALYGLRLVVAPETAQLPTIVRREFVSAWTAGYGVEELAAYLEQQTEVTPGGLLVLRPDGLSQVNHGGLELFVQESQRLQLQTVGDDVGREVQKALSGVMADQRVLFVFDSTQADSRQVAELVRQHAAFSQLWHNTKPQADGGLEVWELSRHS